MLCSERKPIKANLLGSAGLCQRRLRLPRGTEYGTPAEKARSHRWSPGLARKSRTRNLPSKRPFVESPSCPFQTDLINGKILTHVNILRHDC